MLPARHLLFGLSVVLFAGLSPVRLSAQEAIVIHEGEIDCFVRSHGIEAANAASYRLTEVFISSYELVGTDARGATKRCRYRPSTLRLTLPPGSAAREWNFTASTPTVVDGGRAPAGAAPYAVVTLTLGTATCSTRATIIKRPNKTLIGVGDLGALFDAEGRPRAGRCNAQ